MFTFDSKIAAEVCFRLSKWRVQSRDQSGAGARASTFDEEEYQEWRSEELSEQFTQFFSPHDIEGKDVLDFGCGAGDLSFCVSEYNPKSIIGLELVEEGIRLANERLAKLQTEVDMSFRVSSSPDTVELEDESVDVILCFDVLEHVMNIDGILSEWRRILRPGGKILIWWVPWFHPWGPHIESLVPIPWAHVFFSERVLIDTCARIRDMPEYSPRIWDYDDDGNYLPNKWYDMRELPEVNRLTIRDFEQILPNLGFSVLRREIQGFGGSKFSRLSRPLSQMPFFNEYLASCVAYVITR